MVWDGPAIAVALSAAAIAVGVLVLPWMTTSYRGADTSRSLWWLLTDVDTEGLSTVDELLLTTGAPWFHVLGALIAAASLGWLVRDRSKSRDAAGVCVFAAVVAGYIAWLFRDAAEDATAFFGVPGARADLGPGGYLTVAGFIAGAASAWWMANEAGSS